jgi:hypothetical protein
MTLTATMSYAQTTAQASSQGGDAAAVRNAQSTLPQAIDRVEAKTGAKVIEARSSQGGAGVDVLAVDGDQLQYLRLSGADGAVSPIDAQSRPTWMADRDSRGQIDIVRKAKVPLAQAVLTAEQALGLPAVAAGVAPRSASASAIRAYNVVVGYPDGRTRRVAVDTASGRVIRDPAVLEG